MRSCWGAGNIPGRIYHDSPRLKPLLCAAEYRALKRAATPKNNDRDSGFDGTRLQNDAVKEWSFQHSLRRAAAAKDDLGKCGGDFGRGDEIFCGAHLGGVC